MALDASTTDDTRWVVGFTTRGVGGGVASSTLTTGVVPLPVQVYAGSLNHGRHYRISNVTSNSRIRRRWWNRWAIELIVPGAVPWITALS